MNSVSDRPTATAVLMPFEPGPAREWAIDGVVVREVGG